MMKTGWSGRKELAVVNRDGRRGTLKIDISGRVEWLDGCYVAFCNEMPLVGAGATAAEAMSSLLGSLKCYFECIEESGLLDEVVKSYGLVEMGPDVNLRFGNFNISLPGVHVGGLAAVGSPV